MSEGEYLNQVYGEIFEAKVRGLFEARVGIFEAKVRGIFVARVRIFEAKVGGYLKHRWGYLKQKGREILKQGYLKQR